MLPDWRQIPTISFQRHFRAGGAALNEEAILEVYNPSAGLHPITGEQLRARTQNGRIYIQPQLKLIVWLGTESTLNLENA